MKSPDNLKVRPDDAPLRSHLSDWLRAAGNASTRVLAMVERQLNASDSEATCWTDALGPVIDDLDLLNRNTEQDFLTIGGKLSEFIGAVNLISSDLRALADSQNGLRAASALTNSLEFSAKMSARGAGRRGGLESMRQEVGRLRQTLTGFHGTVLTFHTLGLLTRIESARLGAVGAQFSNLADDMKSVAANVQARVERALDIADSLLPPIEDAIQRISAIEDGQAKDLPGRDLAADRCQLQHHAAGIVATAQKNAVLSYYDGRRHVRDLYGPIGGLPEN